MLVKTRRRHNIKRRNVKTVGQEFSKSADMASVRQLRAQPRSSRPGSLASPLPHADTMDLDGHPVVLTTAESETRPKGDHRIVVVVFDQGQEKIVSAFADVLSRPLRFAAGLRNIIATDQDYVIGVLSEQARKDISSRNRSLVVVVNTRRVGSSPPQDDFMSASCDYEFLYSELESPFFRQDLARFTSFILGQIDHHDALMAKARTCFLSMTFPDVRMALPNLDILTVGADAVEIRVDLLQEPRSTSAQVPSLEYVGEQVMLLRQRTELPIIFTTRCTRENGLFPMDNPDLYYQYLHRAIQWGVDYIDVEIWLPEEIRRKLFHQKGNSRIISAWHDFSGTFKWWPSSRAQMIFLESRKYADIVKMIAFVDDDDKKGNLELESFRSKIRSEYLDAPPLFTCMVNMGETGQISRTMNKTFTPITHPLLPCTAAPGQMSAAEINAALSLLGQLPKKSVYGVGSPWSRSPRTHFYEKCFHELGLPHQFAIVNMKRLRKVASCIEALCDQRAFGGAYLSPAIALSSIVNMRLRDGRGPTLTKEARVIGMMDTIIVRSGPSAFTPDPVYVHSGPSRFGKPLISESGLPSTSSLIFENASWRGILSTLTRDFAPSAYSGRLALVLASNADDAASAIFALDKLKVGKIYTVGFKAPTSLSRGMDIEKLENLRRAHITTIPFVIISALGPEKRNIVRMLLRVFGGPGPGGLNTSQPRKVFLDLADSLRKDNLAEQSGFSMYGVADVTAFTTVETFRLLVGQNVPYSFVRLTSGQGAF